jgi:hypothetical protein
LGKPMQAEKRVNRKGEAYRGRTNDAILLAEAI